MATINRRTLLKGAAGTTAAASLTIAGHSRSTGFAAPAFLQGLSGEITVGYADEAGYKPKYVEAAAEAVQAANPEATVNIDLRQISSADFLTQLLLQLDSGEGPDVIHVAGDRIGELAEAGYIEPLDAYVAEWPDWSEQYPESVRAGVTYNGQVWAIPYGLDMRWLYFRRDIMEQVGLGRDWQPANLAAVLEAATAIKEAGLEDVVPFALYAGTGGAGGTINHGFLPILFGNNGALMNDEGKWVADTASTQATFQFYADAWQNLEVVPSEILTTPEPWKPMREGMGTGRVALLMEGGWVYGAYQAGAAEGTINLDDIGYVLFPKVDAGPSFTIGGPGTVWYINAASENKDLAWEFIKAFNNAETVAQLNIEDPHPVARADSAALPEFQEHQYLVDCTEALNSAIFTPPTPEFTELGQVIQDLTGQVAAGDMNAEEAAARYIEELTNIAGADNVVTS